MNKRLGLYILGLLFLLVACQRNSWKKEVKGMKAYAQKAFWYKLMTQSPNQPKPKVGEQVRIDYTLKKGEEVLDHSYRRSKPVLVQIPPDKYDNFFTQALKLMGAGDSLIIKLTAEKAGDLLGQYADAFEADELVTFTYKLHWIKDAQTLNQEIQAEAQRIDSIRTFMRSLIDKYKQPKFKKDLAKTGSGLHYRIIKQGEGQAIESGDQVAVHYMCFLTDGTEIQNSFQLMTPMELEVGSTSIIDGWSEGVALLNRGGKAVLFIPPHLAYGDAGVEDMIPPNATMIFYIEVI